MERAIENDGRGALSRAWNDKETRSIIIQIASIFILVSVVGYLLRNAVVNMEAMGKGLSFDFLWQAANYDINQTLIEYNSQSSHFRAFMVGLLNTLLVAFFGIILSTIVGFTFGVLRLSDNWLISKLVYVYVDYVRNVPLVLHILLVHGFIITTLPVPKKAIGISEAVFFTNRGFFIPKPEFQSGIYFTYFVFILGVCLSVWYFKRAKRIQDDTGETSPVLIVTIAAVIVAPFAAYFLSGSPIVWDMPVLGKFNIKGGMPLLPEFLALWLALSLYTAAFIAEIVRAGIISISKGQSEAAFALGLPKGRTMWLIIIPQALRVIIPPLTSQYLNLTKNSSLALVIGYMDLVATIGGITLNQTGREVECMSIVLAIYLAISLSISSFMNWYNKRMKLSER